MQEQEQTKTEQASPFKLSEAKKRGEVAKSTDFNTLVAVLGLIVAMTIWGRTYWTALCELCAELFMTSATLQIEVATSGGVFSDIATRTMSVLLPFLATGVVVAVVANWVQTGPIFSGEPLKLKFERLNPAAGLQRLFNKRMLFEAFKSLVKLLFFGAITYAFFIALFPGLLTLGGYGPDGQANWIASTALGLLFRLGLGLLVVGLIDVVFVRWQYSQRMMMSRREMKDEVKRREGDPQIRAKIRELQRENLKQAKSMGQLPNADVLITNPTHFAVALRYDRQTMDAPVVLAKGTDKWAQEMKVIARQHGIPIFERRTLAQQLFKRGVIEHPIPMEVFLEVARVYASLGEMERRDARYEVNQS